MDSPVDKDLNEAISTHEADDKAEGRVLQSYFVGIFFGERTANISDKA